MTIERDLFKEALEPLVGEGTVHFERLDAFDSMVSPPRTSLPHPRRFLYMT